MSMNLLSSTSGKSSSRHFIPASLPDECSDAFVAIITRLSNLTFSGWCFLYQLRNCIGDIVTLLLKKVGLDASDPSKYRPISNLNTKSGGNGAPVTNASNFSWLAAILYRLQSAYSRHQIPFDPNGVTKNMQRSIRGCRRAECHRSSRVGSVGRVRLDWLFGSPSTATQHFGVGRSAPSLTG